MDATIHRLAHGLALVLFGCLLGACSSRFEFVGTCTQDDCVLNAFDSQLTCPGDFANCQHICAGGWCVTECEEGSDCVTTCRRGGSCDVECAPGASCDILCEAGSACDVRCGDGSMCTIRCQDDALCDFVCDGSADCSFVLD